MIEPEKKPQVLEIDGSLAGLQALVGGDIQAVYPYDDPVAIICNEEGKLMGLPSTAPCGMMRVKSTTSLSAPLLLWA